MSKTSAQGLASHLLSRMPSGLLVLSAKLRILRSNPAFGGIFGLDPCGITGRSVCDVIPVDGLREQALEVLASKEPVRDLRCHWKRDDELRHLDFSLSLFEESASDASHQSGEAALLLFVEDVTEQEELRRRAQLTERGFRQVIEHSPDGIAVHRDNKFLYANPSFLQLVGVEQPDELIGTWVYEFVHVEDRPALQDRVRRMLTDAEKVPVRETRLLRSDGSEWTADLTARRVIFDGEPAIVSIARDITERKKMTAQMMQMDRMIAAGTLAAGVGHEINNPLTYVTSNIEFSLERLAQFERRVEAVLDAAQHPTMLGELGSMYEALSDAREGSGRIRDIVGQLRTFSPGEESERTTLAIRPVIESVLGMVSNEIRHRAKLVMDLDDEPRVRGNKNKLGQVFVNLLINAAHAIEEGARDDNEIHIRTQAADSWVIIEVTDSGAGIPEEELPRIFDPFFTTKPVGQGTGLGLYICQRIVESHGGRIEVESQRGEGTVVRIRLPRVGQADAGGPDGKPGAEPGAKCGRVLIIDDEPMIGRAVSRALADAHEVTSLSSAHQALEQLEHESFDLILCDLMMPDLTGMDFYAHVDDRFPGLAESIVFITGGAFTPRALEFLEHTPNPCLDKPLELERVRRLVEERVEARRLLR